MKIKTPLIALCALVLGGTTGFSELPDAPPSPGSMPAQPPPPGPGGPKGGPGKMREMREKMRDSLSQEDRARFAAAREKAMQSPEIQDLRKNAEKANKELFTAMRSKMLEIDPGLADIIKKLEADKKNREGKGDKMGRDRKKGGNPPPGIANLTDSEREQLMAARAKVKNDPEVKAAEEKKDAAKTPEERHAAMNQYREAMHKAMVKAAPSIEPLLKKMGPPPPPSKNGPKPPTGPEGEMGGPADPPMDGTP